MASVQLDAAQSARLQLTEIAEELSGGLCSQEYLAAAEETARTLLGRSASAGVESQEIDLDTVALASDLSQRLSEVSRALSSPCEPGEQLQRSVDENTEALLQIQKGVFFLASAKSEFSAVDMAALLQVISRMAATRSELEKLRLAAYEHQLVNVVCPGLSALQLLVAAMGRDLAAPPPPALLTKVTPLVGPEAANGLPASPPELSAWMSTFLNRLEEQTACAPRAPSTEPGYVNLRTQARAIIADLQHLFFARSCFLLECEQSQRAAQR
jgi:hypothetical protein